MNKKILLLILGALVLLSPGLILAAEVPAMVTSVKDAFVTIGGSIVVIGWIITGVLYLTAAGNPEKTKLAKSSLMACVVGTVVIILATLAEPTIRTLLGV